MGSYINLDSFYCHVDSIGLSVVIANNKLRDAHDVVYKIVNDSSFIVVDTIPFLAGNSSDTIFLEGLPLSLGTNNLMTWIEYSKDNNITNDTLTKSIIASNTQASILATTMISCNGDHEGFALAGGSNGLTASYAYIWSNGIMEDSLNMLSAGVYTVTVVDSIGCADSISATIVEPPLLSITAVDNGNGTATASAVGGTGFYAFTWDSTANNQNTATAQGLANDSTYSVTVMDSNGCTDTNSITISIVAITQIGGMYHFNVYPNPTSGLINVDLDDISLLGLKINIRNSLGQIIDVLDGIKTQNIQLEIPYVAGMYFIELITADNRRGVIQILKQ